MSLEADLVAVLTGVCPDVFPDVAEQGTAVPYVTYQQIGGEPLAYVDDQAPAKRNARMQISVWHATRLQAVDLLLQIEAALIAATTFQCRPANGPQALYDEETEHRGCEQDFAILANR